MDRLRRALATRRRRWTAAVVCAVLVAAGVGAWAVRGGDEAAVSALRPMGGGMGLSTGEDVPYLSVLLDDLCVRGDGPLDIQRVEPLHTTGGAEITDFAVVFFREGILGASNRPIEQEKEYRGSRRIDRPCDAEMPPWPMLVVEVHRPGRPAATVRGLRTWYRVGGRLESVDDPGFRLGICPARLDPRGACLDEDRP